MHISFNINGEDRDAEVSSNDRLLDVIREDLHLTGTKEGCGIGECGACTVILDDEAVGSCLVPALQADGAKILTIEGVEHSEVGAILQRCFIEKGAVQCGFCTPGMIMSSYALLMKNPKPTKQEVKVALSGNLCRCTGYIKIVQAVLSASAQLSESKKILLK